MRTEHFKTLMADDTFFTNQILDVSCYAGQIGQWQNGVPQVIDVGSKRTADPSTRSRLGQTAGLTTTSRSESPDRLRAELSRAPGGAAIGAPGGDVRSRCGVTQQ